jgi:hypothetical protein
MKELKIFCSQKPLIMKNKFVGLLLVAGLALASCSSSRTVTSTSSNAAYNVDVPMNIRSSFATSYPDATNIVWNRYDPSTAPIDWELSGWNTLGSNDYAVSFNLGSTQYHAWYDAQGNPVGTSYVITDKGRLPNAVSMMLQNRYSGYTIDKIQTETRNNQLVYELKLIQGESKVKLLVDPSGNIIKEKLKDN